MGTLGAVRPNSSSATAKRCSVEYGTSMPRRASSLRVFESRTPFLSCSPMNARWDSHRTHASPCTASCDPLSAASTAVNCSSVIGSFPGDRPTDLAALT